MTTLTCFLHRGTFQVLPQSGRMTEPRARSGRVHLDPPRPYALSAPASPSYVATIELAKHPANGGLGIPSTSQILLPLSNSHYSVFPSIILVS